MIYVVATTQVKPEVNRCLHCRAQEVHCRDAEGKGLRGL